MQFKNLIPLALATLASAQDVMNLTAVLNSTSELSQLSGTLSLLPQLLATLAEASNITILAPSNQAFEEIMQSDMASALNDTNTVRAILQYHVLNGTYYADNVTETPSFIPTLLRNEAYDNVTGGQVVEALKVKDEVLFYSGGLSNSTVTQAVIPLSLTSYALLC
jgi:uncharacterized surface protein with fasciclin (FAS1) repeats